MRSFKIEGRLKGPEYVAITTKAYRDAVDEAWGAIEPTLSLTTTGLGAMEGAGAGIGIKAGVTDLGLDDREETLSGVLSTDPAGQEEKSDGLGLGNEQDAVAIEMPTVGAMLSRGPTLSAAALPAFVGPDDTLRRELRQVFSRGQDEDYDGLSAGFLLGVRHQDLVRGRNPRHRGLLIGKVQGVTAKGVLVGLLGPVKIGDGVVFDAGKPEAREEGGLIYEIFDEVRYCLPCV